MKIARNEWFERDLLDRFCRYVKIYTTSDRQSTTKPSTPRQWDLLHLLKTEMEALGLVNVHTDPHGYVLGTLPATPGHEKAPSVALLAHVDTAPDAPGENVKPLVHANYDGGVLRLPAGPVLDPAENPHLKNYVGAIHHHQRRLDPPRGRRQGRGRRDPDRRLVAQDPSRTPPAGHRGDLHQRRRGGLGDRGLPPRPGEEQGGLHPRRQRRGRHRARVLRRPHGQGDLHRPVLPPWLRTGQDDQRRVDGGAVFDPAPPERKPRSHRRPVRVPLGQRRGGRHRDRHRRGLHPRLRPRGLPAADRVPEGLTPPPSRPPSPGAP